MRYAFSKTVRLVIFLTFIGLLAACSGGFSFGSPTPAPTILPPTATPIPTAVLEPILPQPTLLAAPANQSSFSLLNENDLASTVTREFIDALPTATPFPTLPPTAEPTEPATATPMPTFTPPALPNTSPNEHYWLRRPIGEGGVVWTDKVYPYGSTRGGTLRPHHGVEFDVPTGTEVLAAASGTVVFAGPDDTTLVGETTNFYGNVVVIQLDSSLGGQPVFNLYGHLSEILVDVGQTVQSQELIALSGSSGIADGPHLHFEVRLGTNSYDSTYNPLLWLYPFPDRGVVAGSITYSNGTAAREVPVTLRRIDAPSPYSATTTYADNSLNSDPQWKENFALDDVTAGYYELTVGSGDDEVKVELWVHPYQTSFIEITLE
ncbi:MAG: peptidoglycan DD-metalloendopeptidase family protein [Candidatus Promineifilaceae bacterium]